MRLSLDRIRVDGETQPRLALDAGIVDQMCADLRGGAVLPPLEVFQNGGDYWLVDGFHRVEAYQRLDYTDADVRVSDHGDARAAFLRALEINSGSPLSLADRKAAAERMLKDAEWSKWGDAEIARRTSTDRTTVAALRKHLVDFSKMQNTSKSERKTEMAQPEDEKGGAEVIPIRRTEAAEKPEPPAKRKATRNGKTYEINTSNIGKAKPAKKEKKGVPKRLNLQAWAMLKHTPIAEDKNQKAQLGRLSGKEQLAVARLIHSEEHSTVTGAYQALLAGAPADDWSAAYQAVMKLNKDDRLRLCRLVMKETQEEAAL